MDKELQNLIKEVLREYIEEGLHVHVHVSFSDHAGMAFRTDMIEKAISEGMSDIASAIEATVD